MHTFKLEKMAKKEQKSSRSYKLECADQTYIVLNFKKEKEKNMEKRKISYTEFLSKIRNANEQIMQKYGDRRITIQTIEITYKSHELVAYKSLEVGVNWAGIGTATVEETRLFINQLNEVNAMAKSLNEELKDCEVDVIF